MSYRHSKKLRDFAAGTFVFNIRHTRLYASNKAPRCPFHMIFQVQLLVYTTNPVMATMTVVADDDGIGGRRRR